MKHKSLLTTLLLILTITFMPMYSNASNAPNLASIGSLSSSILYLEPVKSADTNFTWSLASNKSNTKAVFIAGFKTIAVSVTLSSSKATATIGIIDPDGKTYHTADITGAGYFTYEVPGTGRYKIYIKNTSSSTKTAVCNYSVYEE
jgi:hypothetical protein